MDGRTPLECVSWKWVIGNCCSDTSLRIPLLLLTPGFPSRLPLCPGILSDPRTRLDLRSDISTSFG